jgi:hypothetical protein
MGSPAQTGGPGERDAHLPCPDGRTRPGNSSSGPLPSDLALHADRAVKHTAPGRDRPVPRKSKRGSLHHTQGGPSMTCAYRTPQAAATSFTALQRVLPRGVALFQIGHPRIRASAIGHRTPQYAAWRESTAVLRPPHRTAATCALSDKLTAITDKGPHVEEHRSSPRSSSILSCSGSAHASVSVCR